MPRAYAASRRSRHVSPRASKGERGLSRGETFFASPLSPLSPPPREETIAGSSFSRASDEAPTLSHSASPATLCVSVTASFGVQHRVVRVPGFNSWFPMGNPESKRTSHPPFSKPVLASEPSLGPAPPCALSARAICASVHPGLTIANANSSPGPYMEVVTENEPRPCFSKSDSGTISSARETSHSAHAGFAGSASGADRPPGQPTSSTRHAGQGAWRARTAGGTPHVFTAKVARTPAGLTQSRPRRGCAFEKVREGGSARASRSDRSASRAAAAAAAASARRSVRRRTRAARLESESSETVGRPPPASARALLRSVASVAFKEPSRDPPPNRGHSRSASSSAQSITGSNVGMCESDATGVPLTRVSSNGATRRTQSGASRASCLATTPPPPVSR